jgi:hypothetical protein
MGTVVVAEFGAILGIVLGAAISAGLYGPLTGGQAGADLDSVTWSLRGGGIGGVVGGTGIGVWAVRARRSGRARVSLATTLGALTLGTAGGLAAFPRTAPHWLFPVLAMAAAGAVTGAVLGRSAAVRREKGPKSHACDSHRRPLA